MRTALAAFLLCAGALASDAVDRALAAALARPETHDLTALVREAVLADGGLDGVLARLEEGEPEAAARWLAGRLRRRRGDLDVALRHFAALTDGAAGRESGAAWLHRAELHDATGAAGDARTAYRRALELLEDPAARARIRLRLALLPGGGEEQESLARFAREGDDDALRNRAASVLALLGKPEEAVALLAVDGAGTARFRQEARRAQWALAAKDAARAQTFAWAALGAAEIERDRRYALALLVEAHRADDSLAALVARFAAAQELPAEARNVWIDLLRELGRVDEAIRLFREGNEGAFTVEMRRELLEMCRESGRDELLVSAYEDLMRAEPRRLEWPEGLSRFYLERARADDARALWNALLERPDVPPLPAAEIVFGLGLDDLAIACAERAAKDEASAYPALLFLSDLHRQRGRLDDAARTLDRIDARAPADHPARLPLAEAYERLGRKKQAADVLTKLREARGPAQSEEDLDMRLAVLLSEVGEEERALALWRSLWRKVASPARRSYVEDRLLSAASRLGELADVAIELEEKMARGDAGPREAGLLVRLYTKAGDAVSAAEIVEEYVKRSGGGKVATLKQKARVYLSCTDYHNYEATLRELMKVDPERTPDYLRQLAMSNLERARPDEARKTLAQLKTIQRGSDAVEFEAGVLGLAGLYDDAMAAYRRGLVTFPDRIEAYLLLGDLMSKNGLQQRAVGMFQHLAETAEKDDLFTVAIDGLLNVDAPQPVVAWARRVTLERLAGRHEKMYLYQLLADLSEQLRDKEGQLRALEGSLPIAGGRRASILRELMELAGAGGRGRPMVVIVNGVAQMQPPASRAPDRKLAYGRRLLQLGDLVPPDVYLGLGQSFLSAGAVSAASKTFALARDLPDYVAFQRQVAALFEKAGYPGEALRVYSNLLIGEASNVGLIAKVAELHEAQGNDPVAASLYERAMNLLLARRPFTTVKGLARENKTNRFVWRSGNVDDFDQHYERVLAGILATHPAPEDLVTDQKKRVAEDRARAVADPPEDEAQFTLRRYPRLYYRARFLRRVAIACGHVDHADAVDTRLLRAFAGDPDLLDDLVRARLEWGLAASARLLIEASGRPDDVKQRNRFLAGGPRGGKVPATVAPAEARRLFLPLLLSGRDKEARDLLARTAFTGIREEDVEHAALLVAVAVYLDEPDAALTFGRHWLTALIRFHKQGWLEGDVRRVLTECWVVLPAQHRRSLAHGLVDIALAQPAKSGMLLRLIAQLQRSLKTPLIDAERVRELVRDGPPSLTYQPAPLLETVPEAERVAVLRELWSKVPKSRQAQFLLQLVQNSKEPLPDAMAGFVKTKFRAVHGTLPDGYGRYLVINGLMNNGPQAELALALATVLVEAKPDDVAYALTHAGALDTAGRNDEARAALREAYGKYVALGKPDNWAQQAANRIVAQLGPHAVPAITAAIDAHEEKHGATRATFNLRLSLLQRHGDPKEVLAALAAEAKKNPDDAGIRERLARQLRAVGRAYDGLLVLEELRKKHPERDDLRRRVEAGWKAFRHPLRAAQAAKKKEAPTTIEADEGGPSKVPAATIANLKQAVEAEDFDAARALLRRFWRGLGIERPRYVTGSWRLAQVMRATWPRNAAPRTRRSRGGLPDFGEQQATPPERTTLYEALAAYDFAAPEMARQLRTLPAGSLDLAGPLFDGLARLHVRRDGKAAAVRRALAAAQAPGADKRDVGLLLKSLELAPDELGPETADVLAGLTTSLNPLDTDQVRRLAAVYARTGDAARAARLYRWCATQLHANNDFYRRLQPRAIVDEVCAALAGDERVAVVEAVLRSAAPHLALGHNYTAEDNYGSLVLDTWERVLGPDGAYERCAAMCKDVAATPKPTRRATAKAAAALLARAGETDAAVRCLETAMCRLPVSSLAATDLPPYYGTWILNPRPISYADMGRLFPAKPEGWRDPQAWLRATGAAVERWLADDRLQKRNALQILCVVALRLHEQGDAAAAAALLDRVRAAAETEPSVQLWIADVARATGRPAIADRIERGLLDEKRLALARIPEIVRRVEASDGAAAALALGEEAAEYTLHPDLLDALIDVARAVGRPERATHWAKIKAEAWPEG